MPPRSTFRKLDQRPATFGEEKWRLPRENGICRLNHCKLMRFVNQNCHPTRGPSRGNRREHTSWCYPCDSGHHHTTHMVHLASKSKLEKRSRTWFHYEDKHLDQSFWLKAEICIDYCNYYYPRHFVFDTKPLM